MKYYIIAGEPSGELHAEKLMRGLRAEDGEARFRFCGGERMLAQAGGEGMLYHYRDMSFFGFANVLRNLRTIFRQIATVKHDIELFEPDVVILVDYPSFNMRIAKWAHSKGIKVYYYIAPKVWAWKEWRVKSLRRYVDRLYAIFPFEREYFAKHGIDVVFEGNPLVDDIAERDRLLPSREEFLRENGLDERPIVALLAGSRRSEIRENLPNMVAISRLFPDRQFVVAGVEWLPRELYDEIIEGSDVRYLCSLTHEVLAMAEAAIVTSGTATLETALMRTPELVLYRVPRLYEVLRPYVLKIPYVSLVNINLGREAVRELVTAKLDMDVVRGAVAAILEGGAERERMLRDFDELGKMIGGEGASHRAARDMVNSLKR